MGETRVKNAVNFISSFEELLSSEARRYAADGVICGHIHHAAAHEEFGIAYINTGDWVESCTAVVEHYDGRFELIRWAEAAGAPEASRPVGIEQQVAA